MDRSLNVRHLLAKTALGVVLAGVAFTMTATLAAPVFASTCDAIYAGDMPTDNGKPAASCTDDTPAPTIEPQTSTATETSTQTPAPTSPAVTTSLAPTTKATQAVTRQAAITAKTTTLKAPAIIRQPAKTSAVAQVTRQAARVAPAPKTAPKASHPAAHTTRQAAVPKASHPVAHTTRQAAAAPSSTAAAKPTSTRQLAQACPPQPQAAPHVANNGRSFGSPIWFIIGALITFVAMTLTRRYAGQHQPEVLDASQPAAVSGKHTADNDQ